MKLIRLFPIFAILLSYQAAAAPIFSSSSVVTATDRSATFDSLTSDGIDLTSYSEDSLFVTVNDISYQGFDVFSPGDTRTTGFHYGRGGNSGYVSIRGTDNAVFNALDFLLGDGSPGSTTKVVWESYLLGVLTGSNTELLVGRGLVVGWIDSGGFDEIRVASRNVSHTNIGFGSWQSVALDDVRVQMVAVSQPPITVSEPSIIALFAAGLLGVGFARRRKV
jgi:hypothetical protein